MLALQRLGKGSRSLAVIDRACWRAKHLEANLDAWLDRLAGEHAPRPDHARALVLDHVASTGFQWPVDDPSKRDLAMRDQIERVVVTPESLAIELASERLAALAT
jgi:hypothetical protein